MPEELDLKKSKADVRLLHNPARIISRCRKCAAILAQGEYAIGVTVDNIEYMVGHNPPMQCCGEEKSVPIVTDDMAKAHLDAANVVETLNRDGSTINLRLLQYGKIQSTAQH